MRCGALAVTVTGRDTGQLTLVRVARNVSPVASYADYDSVY